MRIEIQPTSQKGQSIFVMMLETDEHFPSVQQQLPTNVCTFLKYAAEKMWSEHNGDARFLLKTPLARKPGVVGMDVRGHLRFSDDS